MRGYGWAGGFDAVRDVVFDRTVSSTRLCHSRELRQYREEGVARVLTRACDSRNERGLVRRETIDLKVCG